MSLAENKDKSLGRETTWGSFLQTRWKMLEYWRPDLAGNPEVLDMKNWIQSEIPKLNTMTVEPASLRQEKPQDSEEPYWLATSSSEGQVDVIKRSDGKFFNVEGRKISVRNANGEIIYEWIQPLAVAEEKPATIPSPDGHVILPVAGYIGVISDTRGSVLMSLKQEYASENEGHANVVLAIQASVGNISLIREGNPKADQNLKSLLEKLSPTGEIDGLLDQPEVVVPAPTEDPNRELKHNLFLFPEAIGVDSKLHQELVENNKYRWCTPAEIDALALTLLTNSHTLSALQAWEAMRRSV